MKNVYEYRRLPYCDPKMVCDALMEYENMGYEIFKLELQPNGTEYLVYIRKPSIVRDATNDCVHSGTMTLTPCGDKGLEILPWCFYLKQQIKGECTKDCPYKDMPIRDDEP